MAKVLGFSGTMWEGKQHLKDLKQAVVSQSFGMFGPFRPPFVFSRKPSTRASHAPASYGKGDIGSFEKAWKEHPPKEIADRVS